MTLSSLANHSSTCFLELVECQVIMVQLKLTFLKGILKFVVLIEYSRPNKLHVLDHGYIGTDLRYGTSFRPIPDDDVAPKFFRRRLKTLEKPLISIEFSLESYFSCFPIQDHQI